MTKAQDLEIKLSEAREGIREMLELPTEQREATYDASLRKMSDEIKSLEVQYRASILAEGEVEERKQASLQPLKKEVQIKHYIQSRLENRSLDGAEAEYSKEIGLASNQVPMSLFDGGENRKIEERADAIVNVGVASVQTNQQPTQARLFERTIASQLGVVFPSVPVGTSSYPILSDGVSPTFHSAGDAVDGDTTTFTIASVNPTRISARYVLNREDIFGLTDIEQVIRNDISSALAEEMDKAIFQGNGTSPNIAGFFNATSGLTQPSSTPNVADGKAYFSSTLLKLSNQMDGKFARSLSDLSLLLGYQTYSFLINSFRSDETDTSIADYVRGRIGALNSSSFVGNPASNNQKALLYKSGSGRRVAVAPIWQGATMIIDELSLSAKAQIAMTLHAFYSFKILRTDAYKVLSFRTKFGAN